MLILNRLAFNLFFMQILKAFVNVHIVFVKYLIII